MAIRAPFIRLHFSTNLYVTIGAIFLFLLLFSCTQQQYNENYQSATAAVAAPQVIPARSPIVTNIDTCPAPNKLVFTTGTGYHTKNFSIDSAKLASSPYLRIRIFHDGEYGGVPSFKNYNIQEGLALSSIASSYIDKDGYLWFGTFGGGVNRFDGRVFTKYAFENGLAGNVVKAIIQDKNGDMWFATNGNGLSRYDGHYFQNYTTKDGLAHDKVVQIAEDINGDLWFATDGGVSKLDIKEYKKKNHEPIFTNYTSSKNGLVADNLSCVAVDKKGNKWLGSDKGISLLKKEHLPNKSNLFTNYTSNNGLTKNEIRNLLITKNGAILIGTIEGIHTFNNNQDSQHLFSLVSHSEGKEITLLYEDPQGYIWYSKGSGLYRYNSSSDSSVPPVYLTSKHGLQNEIVLSAVADKKNNLWFGTYGGGVSKYEGNGIITYTTNQGLINDKIWSITEDSLGVMWLSTSAGLNRLDERSIIGYTNIGNIARNIRSVIYTQKKNIWFASSGGLSKINGKEIVNYSTVQGLSSNSGLCVFEDKEENIWYGTYGGGISKFNGKTFSNYTTEQGLPNNIIKCITQDSKGNIWLGTHGGGISKFNGKVFTNYSTQQGLANNVIYSIFEDSKGSLWVGTAGGGLSRLKGETFITYNTSNGLPDNVIYAITEDKKNDILWVGTNMGISALHLSSVYVNQDSPEFENFNVNTGYPIKDLNTGSLFVDSKNILWAGTGDKLVRFDYSKVHKSKEASPASIHSIRIRGEKISWHTLYNLRNNKKLPDTTDSLKSINEEVIVYGHVLNKQQKKLLYEKFGTIQFDSITPFYPLPQNLILPANHNSVVFDYGALETDKPQLIKYQYKLVGYDSDWNTITTETSATFGNIPSGEYTFQVKAQSTNGIWSVPATYTFKVLPPWYRTWWMYLVYILTAIITIVTVVRWRIAALRKEKEHLEVLVKERTAEVVEQKELVEKKNELIEEKQKEIVDSINYAKRIQYTLLAHENVLKQHLRNHFVFFQPKDIVSGDFYWASEKDNCFYLAVCDSTGHGVPGAFMSLLNISFLNEAINEKNIAAPNEILNYVRKRLIESISQDGAQDGMDGILLCFEYSGKELVKCSYAAANNAPVIIRPDNTSLLSEGEERVLYIELAADKMPVGKGEKGNSFTLHTIDCKKGDVIYCYTDGYADQFGGSKGKKFKYKQLDELLLSIHKQPVEIQQNRLKETFEKWKGDLEQVDDVLIIGIKI